MLASNDNNDKKTTYWDPDTKKWKTFDGQEQDYPEYDPDAKPKKEEKKEGWGNWQNQFGNFRDKVRDYTKDVISDKASKLFDPDNIKQSLSKVKLGHATIKVGNEIINFIQNISKTK